MHPRIQKWTAKLLPPDYLQGNAEQIRQGRLVVYSAIVVFLAGCIYLSVYLSLGIRLAAVGPGQAIFVVPFSVWLFRRTQSIVLAGNLIGLTCTIGVGFVVLSTGGVHSPGLPWLFFGPLIAMMTSGRTSGLVWYGIAVVTTIVFCALGDSPILPTSEISRAFDPIHDCIVALGLITVVTSAAWSFSLTQETAAKKLRAARDAAETARNEAQMAHSNAMLVLNNVNDGLAMVSIDGIFVGEPSARFCGWFGKPESGWTLWKWLRAHNNVVGELLEINWEQLGSDWMPVELAIDQLPKRFSCDGHFFDLNYRPVIVDQELHHILVICTDVTAELEAEQANKIQQEQMAIFTRFVRDPRSVREFLSEADRLVSRITSAEGTAAEERRWIHTLKGNCGIFGLHTFALWLHELEDALSDDELSGCTESYRDAIASQWTAIHARLGSIVDIERTDQVSVDRSVYESTISEAEAGASGPEIAHVLRRWQWDRINKRLELLAERAEKLADRLGKSGLEVRVESGDVRRPPGEAWNSFWNSIVHVVRNAIDHGVEPPEERVQIGKSAEGHLVLRASEQVDDTFIFEVADDGAGINWVKVARKCRALGLDCDNPKQLQEAVFCDGLSTRDTVTETSGRGVGMAAVREACQMLGGEIEIESVAGQGTTFRFIFPPAHAAAST